MRQIKFLLAMFLFVTVTTHAAVKKIDFTDPQKPIVVKQSTPNFVITISSNPTTGYIWSLKNYENNLIKPVSHKYYPPPAKLMGASGYEQWFFTVKPAGFVVPHTTNITLIYARPWELQGAQASNFKVVTQ